MKKFLLSLAALALSASAAFAQDAVSEYISGVNFSAPGQVEVDEGLYTLNNPEVTITMEFLDYEKDELAQLGYSPKLMVATGMGFGVEPAMYDLDATASPSVFTFTMNEAKWGQPYMGMLNAALMVCFLNEDMDFLLTEDEEPLFFQAVYSATNTFPAKYVSVYPNNDWSDDTFAHAYNDGFIRFSFDNVISFADNANAVSIIWRTEDETMRATYSYDPNATEDEEDEERPDVSLGWSPLDGNFVAEVRIKNPDFDAVEIDSITITLNGVRSLGEPVQVPSITLNNEDAEEDVNAFSVRRNSKGANTASVKELGCVENEVVEVYNLQGMLIKTIKAKEVNSLKPGLYIVNGKKFIVR